MGQVRGAQPVAPLCALLTGVVQASGRRGFVDDMTGYLVPVALLDVALSPLADIFRGKQRLEPLEFQVCASETGLCPDQFCILVIWCRVSLCIVF